MWGQRRRGQRVARHVGGDCSLQAEPNRAFTDLRLLQRLLQPVWCVALRDGRKLWAPGSPRPRRAGAPGGRNARPETAAQRGKPWRRASWAMGLNSLVILQASASRRRGVAHDGGLAQQCSRVQARWWRLRQLPPRVAVRAQRRPPPLHSPRATAPSALPLLTCLPCSWSATQA